MHIGLISRAEIDYALDLANELSEEGLNVTLYLCREHVCRLLGIYEKSLERLYELYLLPRNCKVRLIRLPRMRDPRSFTVFYNLSKTIHKDRVNIAHILLGPGELWFAVFALLLRNIPVISTLIVPRPNIGEKLPFFVNWAIHKIATYGSNIIIVNGKDHVSLVHKLYGIPVSRISYVPLCIGKTALKLFSQKNTEELGTILFFGNARKYKGLEYLIKAQPIINRKIPYARILISTHSADLERYRQMIQDNNKFEIHEGFVSWDIAANFFDRACLVVLPYLSASTSGVLMSAYAFGKPVVATRIGCLPEYVEDGVTGFLVSPRNVKELAEAVIRLLSDEVLRHKMGKKAKHWVEKEQKKITKRLIRIYKKVNFSYRR